MSTYGMRHLVALFDAIRAAQCTRGNCRGSNNGLAQLREILCDDGAPQSHDQLSETGLRVR